MAARYNLTTGATLLEVTPAALTKLLITPSSASIAKGSFDGPTKSWTIDANDQLASAEDYRRYIARMNDIPRYFARQTENARAGLKRGYSVPRASLEGRDVSIASAVVDDPEKSPFWGAFAKMPARIPQAEQEALKAAGRTAIANAVTPAYARFLKFFREEYLPRTRTTLAASKLPDGDAYYAQQIREYTTTDLSATRLMLFGLAREPTVRRLIAADHEWVPPAGGEESLYLRPFMIATEPGLGVRPRRGPPAVARPPAVHGRTQRRRAHARRRDPVGTAGTAPRRLPRIRTRPCRRVSVRHVRSRFPSPPAPR